MHLQAGVITTFLGSMIAFAFGTWTEALTLLAVLMVVDYITGVTAAVKCGAGLNSNLGFWGLAKKGLTLLVVMVAYRVDVFLGMHFVMGGAVTFYIVNELLSIIENYGRMGLPLPESLRKAVEVLRNRTGGR